eukprot:scaffold60_cov137-Skeletonema_marinoi.AAC.13
MDALIKFSWRPLGGSERCNKYIFKGGVCWRQWANRNHYDESTASGSEDTTTLESTEDALSLTLSRSH